MSREVKIGNVIIGGGVPPVIQSMCTAPAHDVDAIVSQINSLAEAGCGIVRIAVPDFEAAAKICEIVPKISVPLVADIHFNYKLAISSIENGAHKIRINPGNIGGEKEIAYICNCLNAHNCALRIGVNSGSINAEEYDKYGNTPCALAASCLRYVKMFEAHGFYNIVLSAKSSSVKHTVEAYRELHKITDYPLHLGVTEAGLYESALAKSAVALGSLLLDGIGDTIRVSVTGNPLYEVRAAKLILRACGIDKNYCEIISCPTCGRCSADLIGLTKRVEEYVRNIKKPLKIAVMGCAVNGPGEAKEADLGIACSSGNGAIFVKGEIAGTYPENTLYKEFIKRLNELL